MPGLITINRSLYWRIALGFIALLAVLLVVQTALAVWMTDRVWGRAHRTPAALAEAVAQDLSGQLAQNPSFDVERYRAHAANAAAGGAVFELLLPRNI